MNGLDLFSGIGGLTKALEGYVRPVAYCENDRYAQGVLLSRMANGDLPLAPIWDDIRTLEGEALPPVDIIYGGFPCQDISVAGRSAGLEGERSGLFFEIVRLIGEIQPEFVFLENVAALTVRGAERVVGELCRIGYDCRWGILSAADVGANHRRERWWLLAHGAENANHRSGKDAMADTNSKRRNKGRSKQSARERRFEIIGIGSLANTQRNGLEESMDSGIQKGKTDSAPDSGWWTIEPNVGRVAHGIPWRVDRLRGLGNAVVPAQAREAFERLIGIK